MASKNVIISAVTITEGLPVVTGTTQGIAFVASPFQWGKKVLMKICTFEGETLDFGTRVAVGQKSKAAIRNFEMSLPVSRRLKGWFWNGGRQEGETCAKPVVAPAGWSLPAGGMSSKQLVAEAKGKGIKGASSMTKVQLVAALSA